MKYFATAALTAFAVMAIPLVSSHAAEEDRVVATVNGEKVMDSEVRETLDTIKGSMNGAGMPEPIYRDVLGRVIERHLLTQAADNSDIKDDPAFQAQVDEFQRRLARQLYLQRILEKEMTDERLQQAYADKYEQGKGATEVHARHILVPDEATAKSVIKELEDGADFAELATKRSVGPSAPKGGDLGFFTKDRMVAPFAEAAFKLEPGEITKEPVLTQFGWHVIKVEEKRKKPAPSFAEVRDQLMQEESQRAILAHVEDLRDDAEIETMVPDDTKSEDTKPEATK